MGGKGGHNGIVNIAGNLLDPYHVCQPVSLFSQRWIFGVRLHLGPFVFMTSGGEYNTAKKSKSFVLKHSRSSSLFFSSLLFSKYFL